MRVVPLQQGHNSPGYHIADGRTGALRMLAQTRGNILGQLDRDRYDRGRDANRALDRLADLPPSISLNPLIMHLMMPKTPGYVVM